MAPGFGESLEFAKDDAVEFAFEFRSIVDRMELSSGWPVVQHQPDLVRLGFWVNEMHASPATPDRILHIATEAVQSGEDSLLSALDQLPAAIYVTDPDGVITYYNAACIAFAGRVPQVGTDRWCVTWKLYSENGAFLPHNRCPMAAAILEKRSVRGVAAVAERPDGSRVNFMPYPTPIFDTEGNLLGAVNILVDLTDSREAEFLRLQARKCRRLAISVCDQQTVDALTLMATEYEQKADELYAR